MLKYAAPIIALFSLSSPALAVSCVPPSREMIVECDATACKAKVGIKKGISRGMCSRSPSGFDDIKTAKEDTALEALRKQGWLQESGLHEVAIDSSCYFLLSNPPRPDSLPEALEKSLARCLERSWQAHRPNSSIEDLKKKWKLRFLYERSQGWILLFLAAALLELNRRRLVRKAKKASTVAGYNLIGISAVWILYCFTSWAPDNYVWAGLLPLIYGIIYLEMKTKGPSQST